MSRNFTNREFVERVEYLTRPLYLYADPVVPEDDALPTAQLEAVVDELEELTEP